MRKIILFVIFLSSSTHIFAEKYEDCENCDEMRIKYAKEHCMIADTYIDKWIQDGEEHTRLKCHNKIIGYGTDYSYRIEEKEVIK